MKKLPIILAACAAFGALISCDNTSKIGQSIVQDKIDIIIDSAFTVTGNSIKTERVQSRTITQLFGKIDAPGFAKMQSDIVTQFLSSSTIGTEGLKPENVDSLVLYLYVKKGGFIGDSISPMGIEVYRLNKNLPSPIYSDFDPAGYYDENDMLGSTIYNLCNESQDTIVNGSTEIRVPMPRSLGQELLQAYIDNNSNFSSPTAFVDNVFKGVYIKNSFGSGRLACSSSTMMTLFFHYYEEDSLIHASGNYFAVTPEIITNNDVNIDLSPEINAMVSDGENIVVAPAGLEVSTRFPAPEIMASYKSPAHGLHVLNTVSFVVPAQGIVNDFGISMPSDLLMVLTKDKEKFFEENLLPDNVTSFQATYNSAIGGYDFGEMREYILKLLEKETITPDDYTFTIMPIYAEYESSNNYYGQTVQTLVSVAPYMSQPVMAKLDLDKAKIKLTYSTQEIEK